MFIESIEVRNYGPFSVPTTLKLEPDVTVLTGPNDTGKSSLLRLISRALTVGEIGPELTELNAEAENEVESSWEMREDFGAIFRVRLRDGEKLPGWFPNTNPPFDGCEVRVSIAPKLQKRVAEAWLRDGKVIPQVGPAVLHKNLFHTVKLAPCEPIRDVIPFTGANSVEEKLFKVALGKGFQFKNLAACSSPNRTRQLGQAETKLNRQLQTFLPTTLGLSWDLRSTSDPDGVMCSLKDKHGAFTPLGSRGTGVQRVMAILAELQAHDVSKGDWVITFDEPELSLHADSQHLLRQVLEKLASKPNVQVVYSTHSPSMINVMRPESVRLLSRTSREGRATTVIDNEAYRNTFFRVRTSLGVTPADSLLFGSVTVVVEGSTEVVGLPLLIRRLGQEGVDGFQRAEHLLSQISMVDGLGAEFEYLCRLVKSQGGKPVLFLDGDMRKRLDRDKFRKAHPDVPVVLVPGEQEFEQLTTETDYFLALAGEVGNEASAVTVENFRQWEAGADLPPKMAFTKRVDRWLGSLGVTSWSKLNVMRAAVERARLDGVNTTPLLELLRYVERLLDGGGGSGSPSDAVKATE